MKLMKLAKILLLFSVALLVAINIYARQLYIEDSSIIIVGINQTRALPKNETYEPSKIISNCTSDSDCDWISTNCCPENAGAYWECLNKETYIDCKSKLVLCPQILSPKPPIACKCIGGRCSAA